MSTHPLAPTIGRWAYGSKYITDDTRILFEGVNNPPQLSTYDKRKKYFADASKRQKVTFKPDDIVCMDFYDAYFDFNTFSVRLPGFNVGAFKYWDGQPIRYVLTTRDRSATFFVVTFELVKKADYEKVST